MLVSSSGESDGDLSLQQLGAQETVSIATASSKEAMRCLWTAHRAAVATEANFDSVVLCPSSWTPDSPPLAQLWSLLPQAVWHYYW